MTVTELDARTIQDCVSAFVAQDGGRRIRTYARGEIVYDRGARECYSYGRHFPLFRFVPRRFRAYREPDGWQTVDRGAPALFVINGDVWRGSRTRTPDHQAAARRAIAATGIASVVLPFSALQGAGIDIDSIRVLDVEPDRTWEETIVRRDIAEVPRRARYFYVSVERTARTLDGMPERYRREYRRDDDGRWRYLETRPGDDGLYRWTISERRELQPDDDGLYRWTETRHQLGQSLFTAVRNGRRARYLSGFDTNENPPLYFLCEVPRGGFPTVAGALDSLAPRAVHAARLDGREIRRQGDIFLVDTDFTREDLARNGATFARLTQWTRDAKPRPGEIGYRAPDRAREKRLDALETRFARREWRETFRASLASATVAHVPDADRRERNRAAWTDLRARHAAARAACDAAGIPHDSPLSLPCENPHCGAGIGEPCQRFTVPGATAGTFREYECDGSRGYARQLAYQHSRETDTLQRETATPHRSNVGPVSARGARRRWQKLRAQRAHNVETARADLRRATFGTIPRLYGVGGRPYRSGAVQYRRWTNVQAVRAARETLARASAPTSDASGFTSRAHARDGYRRRYGTNALTQWNRARDAATRRYRPETIADTERARRTRAALRRHLAIYGTAHTATEVARIGSAAYVSGTVRHIPELEPGRGGVADHAPVTLTPGRWYLAVRNTVPRQNRRTRRSGAGTVSR